jgi:glycosyltransferase involved in cell wall biosynthesis
MIARLLREKGFKEFIEAAKLIKVKYPDVIFKIVGWAFDENPLSIKESEIISWAKEGSVEYYGRTDDVRSYLAESSVYVLPSYYREGIPRTILEAMATGRAIITTDAPGCRETVINGFNGFLVPAKDCEALAGAMERFIAEPKLIETMGVNSRKLAEDKFDVHKVNQVINSAMGLTAGDGY